MSDQSGDEEFEAFLRQFEPRVPSPLPTGRRRATRTWWALAAATLIAGGVWVGWPEGPRVPAGVAPAPAARSRPTLAELSVVLRPREYDRVMDELEGRVLADPRRSGGALRKLAEGGSGY